jgi:nucleotide-binding universal stress UspA family protein
MVGNSGTYTVVVGVDGSSAARHAAEVALREAAAHRGQLLVVHAWNPVMPFKEPILHAAVGIEHLRHAAQRVLDSETEYLRGLGMGVPIRSRLDCGPAGEALRRAAHGADMLVVGSRGRGRVRGLLLGSVSQAVITVASCSVLVVPAGEKSDVRQELRGPTGEYAGLSIGSAELADA